MVVAKDFALVIHFKKQLNSCYVLRRIIFIIINLNYLREVLIVGFLNEKKIQQAKILFLRTKQNSYGIIYGLDYLHFRFPSRKFRLNNYNKVNFYCKIII